MPRPTKKDSATGPKAKVRAARKAIKQEARTARKAAKQEVRGAKAAAGARPGANKTKEMKARGASPRAEKPSGQMRGAARDRARDQARTKSTKTLGAQPKLNMSARPTMGTSISDMGFGYRPM